MPDRSDLIRFVEQRTHSRVINARVQSIRLQDPYRPGEITIRVGEMLDPRLAGANDEPVWAIFETGHLYMVVTPFRGGLRDQPYLFRRAEVLAAK